MLQPMNIEVTSFEERDKKLEEAIRALDAADSPWPRYRCTHLTSKAIGDIFLAAIKFRTSLEKKSQYPESNLYVSMDRVTWLLTAILPENYGKEGYSQEKLKEALDDLRKDANVFLNDINSLFFKVGLAIMAFVGVLTAIGTLSPGGFVGVAVGVAAVGYFGAWNSRPSAYKALGFANLVENSLFKPAPAGSVAQTGMQPVSATIYAV